MSFDEKSISSTIKEEFLPLSAVEDLGRFLRAQRKARKLTIQDAAALAGCSVQFLHDLETGKPTIRMGLALKYTQQLGLKLHMSGPQLPAPPDAKKSRGRKPETSR